MATPRIGTAMTSIFVAAIPLVSMLISHLLGLERISAHGLAGIALGALGIMMLVGFPSEPVTGTFVLGCGAALLSALFAAYGSNYASLRLKGAGSWETTIGSFLAGGIMTLPLVFAAPVPAWPSPASFGYLLVLGGVMSAMNYVLYFRLVADIGATKAISVEFLVTIVAVAIGTLHLGERLSVLQVCGAGIIMAGCALVLGLFSHDTAKAGR